MFSGTLKKFSTSSLVFQFSTHVFRDIKEFSTSSLVFQYSTHVFRDIKELLRFFSRKENYFNRKNKEDYEKSYNFNISSAFIQISLFE